MKLFSDVLDALAKIIGSLKAVSGLPKNERDRYRQVIGETYQLIDATLNMVIIRLGDILHKQKDSDLLQEVELLENYQEWMEAERKFRLCQSLRIALRETESLQNQITGRVSMADWNTLVGLMRAVLASEGEIANYIGQKFCNISDFVRRNSTLPDLSLQTRDQLRNFREALSAERQRLLQQEVDFYSTI